MTRTRLAILCAYIALVVLCVMLSRVLPDFAKAEAMAVDMLLSPMGLMVLALFAILLALPFVPGAEIGLALLMVFGAKAVPLVWLTTVLALCLSYCMGRFVPPEAMARGLAAIGARHAADLVRTLAKAPMAERGALLEAASPGGPGSWLARNRYLALAVLFNLPGNTLLGGGGGIAFAAGASRLFAPLPYVALVTVAVSPVPIMFALWGG